MINCKEININNCQNSFVTVNYEFSRTAKSLWIQKIVSGETAKMTVPFPLK